MTHWLLALAAGALVGAVFGFLRLPVPAPPSVAGILGIVGLAVGYGLVQPLIQSR